MIDLYYFFDFLSKYFTRSDVVVTDAGSTFNAAAQGLKIKEGMRYILPGGLAPMGYGLPASIGIQLALKKSRVIYLTGEGSFQLNIQELQSVVHHQIPIKVFIFNNDGYLTIRTTQERYFKRFIGESSKSGISFPDTKRIARAYGIKFVRLCHVRQLKKTLNIVLDYRGPVICEVIMPRDQKVIKPLEDADLLD